MTYPVVYQPEQPEEDFWSGLGDAIFEGFISPILDFFNTVWDAIVEFFQGLGTAIYNAVVGFVDTTISFIEYVLNSIRQYLPYAIMVTISWTMITRAWKNEKISVLKKIGYTLTAPVVGYLVARVFDAIVPLGVQFPRLSMVIQPAKITGSYDHTQYVNESVILVTIQPITVAESYDHTQYIDESVTLRLKGEVVEESFEHTQIYYEAVVLEAPLIIQETFDHQQTYYEQVTLA